MSEGGGIEKGIKAAILGVLALTGVAKGGEFFRRPPLPEGPVDNKIYTIEVAPGVNIRREATIASPILGTTPNNEQITTEALKVPGHIIQERQPERYLVTYKGKVWGMWFNGEFETLDGSVAYGSVASQYVDIINSREATPEEQQAILKPQTETTTTR